MIPCCSPGLLVAPVLVLLPAYLETQEPQAVLSFALTLPLGRFCPMTTCQPVSAQHFLHPDSNPRPGTQFLFAFSSVNKATCRLLPERLP